MLTRTGPWMQSPWAKLAPDRLGALPRDVLIHPGGGGGDVAMDLLFLSAAGGAYWPIAICCPSLPFPYLE